MIQIVYVSAARDPFSQEALSILLAKSRVRNALYSVTGMLLYHSGSFLQILEGPVEGVQTIFSSIARDPRHLDTKVLHNQPIDRREFADWSMGFLEVDFNLRHTPGKIDYRTALMRLPSAPTAAKRYLRLFHQGLCRQALTV
jgi:hypothetical protein